MKKKVLYIRGHKTVPFMARMEHGHSVFCSKRPRALARGASFFGVLIFSIFTFCLVCAQEKPSKEPPSDIPDWLKRISYGINIETDQKPRIYFETVQPIYQTLDKIHTFFTHDRISIQDERGTYSAGYGYRRLLNDNLLIGINNFFDFQDLHKHYRTGVGLEALTQTLELRTNSYFRMSPKRTVESTSTSTTYERVANGGDIELGAPLPYLPWIKVFGSYYRYAFQKPRKDMVGWKARTEFKPFKFMAFNYEVYDDNKGDIEYRMDGRFNFAFDDFTPKGIFSALNVSKEIFPKVDLKERTLDRVERNFVIQVEKWMETSTATMEIKRGN